MRMQEADWGRLLAAASAAPISLRDDWPELARTEQRGLRGFPRDGKRLLTRGRTVTLDPIGCEPSLKPLLHEKGLAIRSYRVPPAYVARISNCRLVGDRFVVITGERPIRESMPTWWHKPDPLWPTRFQSFWPTLSAAEPEHLREPVAVMTNANWSNYGHWFHQCLTNISLLKRAGLYDDVRLLVPRLNNWRAESLELLGVPRSKLVVVGRKLYHCETLFFPSFADKQNQHLVNPETLATYDEMAERVRRETGPLSLRPQVYVSRLGVANRRLTNEVELVEALRSIGFETIVPSLLTVREQIRRMLGARIIVGPAGANMMNAVFAPAGSVIVELFPKYFFYLNRLESYTRSQARSQFYSAFVSGDKDGNSEGWRVDVGRFVKFVRATIRDHEAANRF